MKRFPIQRCFRLPAAAAVLLTLCSCGSLPENDPNYRNPACNDVRIGKTYEPYEWKMDNTATACGTFRDLITGKRKMTW